MEEHMMSTQSPIGAPRWWKDAIIYQIWPASYKDSNGDGLGDIPGIISTLDYVKELGVNTIWLSPMYASPQADMGYDISNYEDVYPPYGTLADMDRLIEGVHERGMHFILDLVVNHTSDEHAWFVESRTSRTNPKSDWYIWKDPKLVNGEKGPPNNWGSYFGGSAWEYVSERDQYYLHLFEKGQPDLNWESAEARRCVYDSAIRFWLKKGVDGFRVDAGNLFAKDLSFPDAEVADPDSEFQMERRLFANGANIHDWYKEIRSEVLNEFGDVIMIGEFAGVPYEELLKYASESSGELNMILDMAIVLTGGNWTLPKHEVTRPTLLELKQAVRQIQNFITNTELWGTVFDENHDQSRSVSRFGTEDPRFREQSAKVLAMLLGSLSGTLFIYQGQEIGMMNMPDDWSIEDCKDVDALNYWQQMKKAYPESTEIMQRSWATIRANGRDNARTPVQWNTSKNAGFTTGEPWMHVNPNYKEINIEVQLSDPESVLSYWRRMLDMRKRYSDLFVYGQYREHESKSETVFTFEKQGKTEGAALVVLNFSNEETEWMAPHDKKNMQLLLSNRAEAEERLHPWEGRIYLIK